MLQKGVILSKSVKVYRYLINRFRLSARKDSIMENWIDINKFHTFSIKRYYISKIEPKDVTIRMLLLNYFQISSYKYRTEEDMVRVCEDLYDFNYSVKWDLHGTYWMIAFQGNAIDPKYINDKDYNEDKVFNVFEDLATPLVINNKLDKKTFTKAKRHLKATIQKMDKYPQAKATAYALHLYFKDTIRDYSPFGDLEELNQIIIEDLYQYYLKFMKSEVITIVLGNSLAHRDFKDTVTPHNDHNFIDRAILDKDIYLYPYKSKQLSLRIIYDTNIFTGDKDMYAISLYNYYLGSSAYSYLFRTVREKYGLCYGISSDAYGASGILLVSAEIKKKDLKIAIEKIDEAIDCSLEFFDLEKMKRVVSLTHKASYDNQGAYISDLLVKKAFPIAYDSDTFIKNIEEVTMDDIKRVVHALKGKKKVFGYGGDQDE